MRTRTSVRVASTGVQSMRVPRQPSQRAMGVASWIGSSVTPPRTRRGDLEGDLVDGAVEAPEPEASDVAGCEALARWP